MADYLRNIVKLQKQGKPVGIYSACTGNRLVLEACMRHALKTGTVLLIESTANQVDQYGGYTGMKPADFMEMCKELAREVGMPMDRIILGGDHLGPLTFAGYDEEKAMSEARELIRQYVAAGFTKIHIDTSMKVASDDPDTRLADEVIARRGLPNLQRLRRIPTQSSKSRIPKPCILSISSAVSCRFPEDPGMGTRVCRSQKSLISRPR